MRNAFANEVTQLAKLDDRVVLLSGDIGNKLFDDFKRVDAARFFNCGVAEANMMGVAAGMALSGLRPIIYTITPFTTTRCFEQIRVDVCYHQAPVVIVGTGSGLSYAELGPTHHSLEDMAILRTLPDMQVYAPCDSIELRAILQFVLQQDKPAYIRIGKKGEPNIHSEEARVEVGKINIVRDGHEVILLGAGTILPEVLKAADILQERDVSASVASVHCVKPLDIEFIKKATEQFPVLVSVEEHGEIGGLGSAIADWMVSVNSSARLLKFATPNEFMHETGSQEYARKKYGLTGDTIAEKVYMQLKGC